MPASMDSSFVSVRSLQATPSHPLRAAFCSTLRPLPLSAADAAVASTGCVIERGLLRERMPVDARLLALPLRTMPCDVLGLSDRLQVIQVDAPGMLAQVVQHDARKERAVLLLPEHPVGVLALLPAGDRPT